MENPDLPAPSSAPNGTTPSSSPTPIIITTAAKTRTVYRSLDPKDRRIELGGGAMFPKIKCSRKDLGIAVLAIAAAAVCVYGAKTVVEEITDGIKKWKEKRKKKKNSVSPSVQTLAACVSSSSGPKPAIIPGLLYQGGTLILGGRTGIGKSLFIGQMGMEIARGYGEFIPPTADGSFTPRAVIIIDGEVANHLAKVPEGVSIDETLMAGSANITRFASSIAILDKSARGSDYRFLKILKERKNGVPADVIELEYTEKEYKHYNFFGTISEDEVLYTKTNRKRFGHAVVEEEPEEEESQNPRPRRNKRGAIWDEKEDTERLKALIESGEELDYEAIAKEFGCSSKTIERKVKNLKEEGSEE